MRNKLTQKCVLVAFIVLAIFVINPFHIWMPTMTHIAILAALVVMFGIMSVFVLQERAEDERDNAHRMVAGRTAYLSGAGVLLMGIVIQSIEEQLDPWLVVALLAMVFGKMFSRLYNTRRG